MKNFWTVFRFELLLSWRGPVGWLITPVMALLGIGISIMVNQVSDNWWSDLCLFLGMLTLLLALTTGNQIHRDSERRLDGIVLSTPLATSLYVLGKYLAGLFSLLVYGTVVWLTFIITSFLLRGNEYYTPPIGVSVYIQAWLMLVLVPLLFAASLTLLGITLARGQRALVSILVALIWLVPVLILVPKMLTISFYVPHDLIYNGQQFFGDSDFIDSTVKLLVQAQINGSFTLATEQQMVHLYQTVVISEHLSTNFLINRAFFLGLSILLVIGTIAIVRYQRQGKM
ncbi:MAG: ABC-2 transporter permease [Ktedonobacteraceae bacterium]|nr:ABC-2 transporter permease [Ktedonobacteraceae bacterium]MBO0792217.1 ABC-2 transporter permease [Ktedonobacteraceae bacterium]